MTRTMNHEAFTRIANDPSVRPWLGGEGVLDLSTDVGNHENICLLTPNHDGGYILIRQDLGMFEAHSLALPSARGKPMLTLMRDGFRYMMTATDCIEIVARVPVENQAASRWADLAGFKETFRRKDAFVMDGRTMDVSYRSLAYRDWVVQDKRNQREGEAFHAQLEALKPHDVHPEDPVHNAFVGATIEGIRQGNAAKAVALYGRYAAQVGYFAPTLLSINPPMLWQGDAIVSMINGEVSFLKVIDTPEGSASPAI